MKFKPNAWIADGSVPKIRYGLSINVPAAVPMQPDIYYFPRAGAMKVIDFSNCTGTKGREVISIFAY
jgi:hypothetical protein